MKPSSRVKFVVVVDKLEFYDESFVLEDDILYVVVNKNNPEYVRLFLGKRKITNVTTAKSITSNSSNGVFYNLPDKVVYKSRKGLFLVSTKDSLTFTHLDDGISSINVNGKNYKVLSFTDNSDINFSDFEVQEVDCQIKWERFKE